MICTQGPRLLKSASAVSAVLAPTDSEPGASFGRRILAPGLAGIVAGGRDHDGATLGGATHGVLVLIIVVVIVIVVAVEDVDQVAQQLGGLGGAQAEVDDPGPVGRGGQAVRVDRVQQGPRR